MKFKKLSLNEYLERQEKTYLEQALEKNMAEYYLIDDVGEFFFYKLKDKTVDLCINDTRRENSIFDNAEIMTNIFEFLKDQGYKKIIITLLKDEYRERHTYIYNYGFKKDEVINEGKGYIKYVKNL